MTGKITSKNFILHEKTNFDKTEQVTKNDKRLLKIGLLLKRFSIDELLQFFNVLKGDTSIVGPRHHMTEDDIYYYIFLVFFLKDINVI